MEVIYEDNHIIIVSKTSGEIVQGDKTGDKPLSDQVKAYIKEAYAKPGDVFLGVVHRLDRPVFGLVMFARTSKALSRLNAMFANSEVRKTYWAIVRDMPPVPSGTLTHWIVRNEKQNKSYAYDHEVPGSKKAILKDIFWRMNELSSRTESKTEEVITETDDGHGNIVETATTVTHTYLYITVSHKTAEEMAEHFNFTADQRQQLSELLAEENRRLWSAVLYGIYSGDDAIVKVALSQVGNVGGEPYWSWYGFNSRVEWCACFVSWCFNECGYLDTGTAPKFAGCVGGVEWFRSHGQWADNTVEPAPGMIVFFDWNDPNGASGPQDGEADHVGIVEKCENGIVYTIEGNSDDACRQNQYPVGYYEILGYGILNP